MKKIYSYQTRLGPFYIAYDGRDFFAMYEDENLGCYGRPEQAAEDLAGGATYWPSIGNTVLLGIPEDLSEWKRLT